MTFESKMFSPGSSEEYPGMVTEEIDLDEEMSKTGNLHQLRVHRINYRPIPPLSCPKMISLWKKKRRNPKKDLARLSTLQPQKKEATILN